MTSSNHKHVTGWWIPEDSGPETDEQAIRSTILKVTQPIYLLNLNGRPGIGSGGTITMGSNAPAQSPTFPIHAYAPPLHPENLGDQQFKDRYNLRYAQASHDEKELKKYIHEGWGLGFVKHGSTPLMKIVLSFLQKDPKIIGKWIRMYFRYYYNWHHQHFDVAFDSATVHA